MEHCAFIIPQRRVIVKDFSALFIFSHYGAQGVPRRGKIFYNGAGEK
jgi:hypothetical protein